MEILKLANKPSDFSALYAAEILSKQLGECPSTETLKIYKKSLCEKLDSSISRSRKTKNKSSVLFLSNNDFEIRSLKKMFSLLGIDLRFAKTKKIFCKVAKEVFSMVIVSVRFEVSPHAVAEIFRSESSGPPYLILLGMEENKFYKKLGFNNYLKHPFDLIDLEKILKNSK